MAESEELKSLLMKVKEESEKVGLNTGSFSGAGRSPGKRNGNPLQCSCLGNPMDKGSLAVQSTGSQKS